MPRPLYPRERPGTYCIGGWVGPRATRLGSTPNQATAVYFHALANSPFSNHPITGNQDSSVGLATRLWARRSGVRNLATTRNFSLLPNVWVPGSLTQVFNRYHSSFPRVKRPGRDLDHSHPFSAEIKNEWSHTSTPPISLNGVGRYKFTVYSFVKRYKLVAPLSKPSNKLHLKFSLYSFSFGCTTHNTMSIGATSRPIGRCEHHAPTPLRSAPCTHSIYTLSLAASFSTIIQSQYEIRLHLPFLGQVRVTLDKILVIFVLYISQFLTCTS